MFDTETGLSDRERTLKHRELMNSVSEHPLRYALPVYYGTQHGKVINNGSGVLIETSNEIIGVTALHCITGYEKDLQKDPNLMFYFGSYHIDPSKHIIAKNIKLDLVTLRFSKEAHKLIIATPNNSSAKFLVPIDDIYQEQLPDDSVITFGGFPGSYRRQPHDHYVQFGKVSFGPCGIIAASPLQIYCRHEKISNWVQTHYMEGDFNNVGGLSGAPVFVAALSKGGIWHQRLAGIIYEGEYQKEDDRLIICVTPANVIQQSGQIVHWQ